MFWYSALFIVELKYRSFFTWKSIPYSINQIKDIIYFMTHSYIWRDKKIKLYEKEILFQKSIYYVSAKAACYF